MREHDVDDLLERYPSDVVAALITRAPAFQQPAVTLNGWRVVFVYRRGDLPGNPVEVFVTNIAGLLVEEVADNCSIGGTTLQTEPFWIDRSGSVETFRMDEVRLVYSPDDTDFEADVTKLRAGDYSPLSEHDRRRLGLETAG